MILLCYDGSEDSREAAARTASLFPGADVTVLTVWEPYLELLDQSGFGLGFHETPAESTRMEETLGEHARATAAEGAEHLRAAGIAAAARAERRGVSISGTIAKVADELDADAIVLGTRGRGDVTSLLLGSTSHTIVQHADRPVVVVPAPAVARARRSQSDPRGVAKHNRSP
jgi:nucleotide-binding universal stress UspA family protein